MSVFDTMRIAGSGLTAQRLRMDVAAANLANAHSTRSADGGPYRTARPVFMADPSAGTADAPGVVTTAVVAAQPRPLRIYDPGHPDADPDGFVEFPDVDAAAEMTDVMGAARSYSMNATVAEAAKQVALDSLELGR